eukprot:NODE_463_length_1367_cov_65.500000_g333_i0.p1 GENE.NODE_463_length_1367_cov_65.500000_g333_i0~~NODE_463_length_1367_cov_65.500000_g333_i0.p1  ORF type:complete len:277 (+),score=115.03 NODE_463_length_1367_cov_65.500000_g333_i0:104-832(+)
MEKEIEWKAKVLAKMEEKGKLFNEQKHMEPERVVEMERLQGLLKDACDALDTITKNDMAVLRKYLHPPPLVWNTIEAVLKLNGEWNTSWDEAQVVLADNYFFSFFVPRFKRYDLASISEDILNDLEQNMRDPDFQPQIVALASIPCQGLCKLIRAVYEGGRIVQLMKPTGLNEDEVREQYAQAQARFHAHKEKLAEIEIKLAGVTGDLQQRRRELKQKYEPELGQLQQSFFDAHQHYSSLLS